jgi:CRISPR-associated endoribonuclease Cas6
MPHIISLPFQCDQTPLPRLHRALHANLFVWFAAADADLAEDLHQRPVRKPFTLSPLTHSTNGLRVLRVTLLEDDLWEPFQAGLTARPFAEFLDEKVPLSMAHVEAQHQTYENLIAEASTSTGIRLDFLTPTCFRAGGLDSPLPEPHTMVHSWLTRWSQYAPPDIRINVALVDVARAHLAISGYNLHTAVKNLGYGKQIGFLGRVNLRVVKGKKIGREMLRQLNTLADYAEFCGTGWKTTQGMGQTRRVR